MLKNRTIFIFLFKCTGIYVGLILLAMAFNLDPAFGDMFRKSNNMRFENRLQDTKVEFRKHDNKPFDTNIRVEYTNNSQWTFVEYRLDSWYIGFIPKALFIALLLSTTFHSWKRKALTFVLGFIITSILTFFILYIRVYTQKIHAQSILGDFQNTLVDKIIVFLHNTIAVYSWIGFVLPVFAWITVTLAAIKFNVASQFQIK